MRIVHSIVLILLLFFTATAYTQSLDTVEDAVQNQRIQQLERNVDRNTEAITALASKIEAISGSINRFTGIGLGVGMMLTVLQSLILLATYRNGKK